MEDVCLKDSSSVGALIVDDEAHVRIRIHDILSQYSMITILGECTNGIEALESIELLRPDLVFLDIEMPLLDGFDVLNSIEGTANPEIIFVTAFDQHAIRAFEVNALDYVLKPIDESRFAVAVNRALNKIQTGRKNTNPNDPGMGTTEIQPARHCRRLLIRNENGFAVLPTEQIVWAEAADKHVRLHTDQEVHTIRITMKELEGKLDPSEFIRIHRSTIVSLDAVQEVQLMFHGEYKIILSDGTVLTLGRAYRKEFSSKFEAGI